MASSYKVLGQSRPADTTATDLYTVPSGGQVVVSTIAVANTTALTATFRVFVRQDGAAADESTALVFDSAIAKNSTTTLTLGITGDAGDIISVATGTGNAITFTAFGLEIV
tara:strand:- start:1986 stop:2318 length:333 start_codon:yes stop_codon:yes gene_type:complete